MSATVPHKRVLCVGVAVLDFIFQVDAFPTRPVKYRARDAAISTGGNSANAALAIARAGGRPVLCGRIGQDEVAHLIRARLGAEGIDTSLLRAFEGHRSSYSSILIDAEGERQIVNFRDASLSFDAGWVAADAPADLGAILGDTRWPQGAAAAMALARERGVPGIVDAESPVAEAMEALPLASHVAFGDVAALEFTGETDVERAGLAAHERLPGLITVTAGARGTLLIEADATPRWFEAPRVAAIDTLGAGDVWHGHYAMALAQGAAVPAAIERANVAAALKCTRAGGASGAPTASEIETFMTNGEDRQ